MECNNENVVQAVVLMDSFNQHFFPVNKYKPLGLFKLAGVRLLDFALEALAQGGVGEVILFCCQDGQMIKDHVKNCRETKAPWTFNMEVQVLMSDTCQTMGDVMREIDAAGIIRGNFVLMGVNSISNVNFADLLEQHKQTCKQDRGAAMTMVYKKVSWEHPLIKNDKAIFLAADGNTRKILMHKKYTQKTHEKAISIPLEIILAHSEVAMFHNLVDSNIALCSPSVPPLFSDNFDFQTRDDFIYGIVINEEILASSLYHIILKSNEYAATVSNWKTYQIITHDILESWVQPLSIETGSFNQDNYDYLGNHNFQEKTATLSRSCLIGENVLIGEKSNIGADSVLVKSVIGKNCIIGNYVTITGSHIMDNVVIKDNSTIIKSFIDSNCIINENSSLENGVIVASNVAILPKSVLKGNIIENTESDKAQKQLKSTSESGTEWENESMLSGDDEFVGFDKNFSDSESYYSSDSSAESSMNESPIPDDTNIFLHEVIDSLARGYEEKLKCDYLILEINSSRYAYNIQLHEVNFFVVRALLSIPVLHEAKNVLSTIKDIFKHFRPILSNYIKSKSSIMDCLKAVEDSCISCEWLEGKSGQIVHLLYEIDVVDEDSLLEWYAELKAEGSPIAKQTSLLKFFEWLQEASEESDDSQ